MIKNRIAYGAIVLGLAFLAGLSGGGAAYRALGAALLVPLLSLGLTVALYALSPDKLHVRGALCADRIPKGAAVAYTIAIANRSLLPLASVRAIPHASGEGVSMRASRDRIDASRGREIERSWEITGTARGAYDVGVDRVAIYEPFGLLRFTRRADAVCRLTVLPGLIPVEELDVARGLAQEARLEAARGMEDASDIAGLRAYRPTDDAKRIHWAATARAGAPISKEYARHDRRRVLLLLDNAPTPRDAKANEDRLMERLASTAYLLADGNAELTVRCVGGSVPDIRSSDRTALWEAIADIPFDAEGGLATALHLAVVEAPAFDRVVVFSAAPVDDWAMAYPRFAFVDAAPQETSEGGCP